MSINSNTKVRAMTSRRRKKHSVAEYTIYGFRANVAVRDSEHAEKVSDILIDLVEALGLVLFAHYTPEIPGRMAVVFMPGDGGPRSLNPILRAALLRSIEVRELEVTAASELYDLVYTEDPYEALQEAA